MSESTNAKKSDGIGSMIKLGLILAAFSIGACTVLALVNTVTAPVIDANNNSKAKAAMKEIFPSADDFESAKEKCGTTASGVTTLDSMYYAKSGSDIIGAVVQISGPTYDRSTIIVGMDNDGIVTGMRYLENNDTKSFGQNGSDPDYKVKSGDTFYGQFAGKNSADGFVAGETFDAITGATITSNGIATMMNDACTAMGECLSAKSGE